jgi:polyphosphate glucokinase
VGGTGLKAGVLDEAGKMLTARVRVETPVGQPPAVIVNSLVTLVRPLPPFHRVSVGFPGVVRGGVVKTAPNLGHQGWTGFDLATALGKVLARPVRVINDADMQGLAVIRGRGLEMVCTLGTGFGTGLYLDGQLAPHLEISQHPFRKGETYDQQLGQAARKRVGNSRWLRRVLKAFETLRTLTNFDHLYVGGGNAKLLDFKLPPNITVVSNEAGISGGIHLWRQDRG